MLLAGTPDALGAGLPVSPPTGKLLGALGALGADCPGVLVSGVELPLVVPHAVADIASRKAPAIDNNATASRLP